MWLWDWQLQQLGFRRLSERYWQCERGHDLPAAAYLSIFSDVRDRDADGERIEVAAFHVTFGLGVDRVHFYYHEVADGLWEPGGHTSSNEIRRHRRDPAELRALADAVAAAFLAALGWELTPRG